MSVAAAAQLSQAAASLRDTVQAAPIPDGLPAKLQELLAQLELVAELSDAVQALPDDAVDELEAGAPSGPPSLRALREAVAEAAEITAAIVENETTRSTGWCCGCGAGKYAVPPATFAEKMDAQLARIASGCASLKRAVQAADANKWSNLIRNAAARALWERHFQRQRAVPWAAMAAALRREWAALPDVPPHIEGLKGALAPDGTARGETFALCFAEGEPEATVAEFAQRVAEHDRVVRLRCAAPFEEADAGFVLARPSDSLADLRVRPTPFCRCAGGSADASPSPNLTRCVCARGGSSWSRSTASLRTVSTSSRPATSNSACTARR